jgi:hypothetical protein
MMDHLNFNISTVIPNISWEKLICLFRIAGLLGGPVGSVMSFGTKQQVSIALTHNL